MDQYPTREPSPIPMEDRMTPYRSVTLWITGLRPVWQGPSEQLNEGTTTEGSIDSTLDSSINPDKQKQPNYCLPVALLAIAVCLYLLYLIIVVE